MLFYILVLLLYLMCFHSVSSSFPQFPYVHFHFYDIFFCLLTSFTFLILTYFYFLSLIHIIYFHRIFFFVFTFCSFIMTFFSYFPSVPSPHKRFYTIIPFFTSFHHVFSTFFIYFSFRIYLQYFWPYSPCPPFCTTFTSLFFQYVTIL